MFELEKKIIAFLGDFYHKRKPLEQAIQAITDLMEDVNLDSQPPLVENISKELAEDPAMIILGTENRINPEAAVVNYWLTKDLDNRLEAYVANGGSLVVLHCALASYPADSKYRKMIKGEFLSHPSISAKVRYYSQKETDTFIGSSGYDYEVIDEFYVVDVDEADTSVFLYSECAEHGQGFGGWCHDYGKGKVVCVVPTHYEAGLMHEDNMRLYREAIEWGLI